MKKLLLLNFFLICLLTNATSNSNYLIPGESPGMAPHHVDKAILIHHDYFVTYLLTTEINPVSGGTTTGGGLYEEGVEALITATPVPGYVFINWTDQNDIEISDQASFLFTLPAEDVTITANFRSVELGEALDNSDLYFTTGGDAGWLDQTLVTHDGLDAAQTGAITHDQQTWMETTIEDPGQLTFWWKVSSESYDFLNFYINDVLQDKIAGNVDWQLKKYLLEEEINSLRWTYQKDGTIISGADQGWVDQLTFIHWDDLIFYPLTLEVNQENGGIITGEDQYLEGEEVTITAIPILGYKFINWTNEEEVEISNQSTLVYTMPAGEVTLTANFQPVELSEALDNSDLTFTTGGEAGWFDQIDVTHDGVDAAQSGAITHDQQTWMETTIEEPGKITFWWKVSSHYTDFLNFYINGELQNNMSGNIDWQMQQYRLEEGINTLRWTYSKYRSWSGLMDRAWVDQITFTHLDDLILYPLKVEINPENDGTISGEGLYEENDEVTLTAIAGLGYKFINWTDEEGVEISNQSNFVYTMPAGDITLTANFLPVELSEALDNMDLDFTTGGDAGWFDQTDVTHDGVDAAQSSPINDDQQTWMETTIEEPGKVTFWWKVSSHSGSGDYLNFHINGVRQDRIGGDTDWELKQYILAEGINTLRWTYINNEIWHDNLDCGWVDQVTFTHLDDLAVYPLTVEKNLEDGGTITGEGQYFEGKEITLTAMAVPGYMLVNWTDQEGTEISNQSSFVFTMPAEDVALTANFRIVELNEALDNSDLDFTTGGDAGWLDQTLVTKDGIDAAQNGPITHDQQTWMETTIEEPGLISFWWKVYSQKYFDNLNLYINGEFQERISGDVDWQYKQYMLDEEINTLRWTYIKDGSWSLQGESGWVDQVVFTPLDEILYYPLTIEINPENGGTAIDDNQYFEGEVVSLTTIAIPGYKFINWTDQDHVEISNQNSFLYTMPAEHVTLTANFRLVELCEAVDNCDLTFTTGGYTGWVDQTLVSNDGNDAAQSGAITQNQRTWMETIIEEPGKIEFWWKVSSLTTFDYLGFYINGELQDKISGEGDWNLKQYRLDEGLNTLRWTYTKTVSGQKGLDCGFIDQIVFTHLDDLILYPLTIKTNLESGGIVTGEGLYEEDDEITLTATPAPRYIFLNWTDQNDVEISNQASLVYTMPAEGVTVTANFEKMLFSLQLLSDPVEGGAVIGTGIYTRETEVTLKAFPVFGYEFDYWSGDTEHLESAETSETAMYMPSNDLVITARFKLATSAPKIEEDEPIQVFPNPAHDKVNIHSSLDIKEIRITDLSGRVVYTDKPDTRTIVLTINHLSKGVYLINITTNTGSSIKQLIIN